MVRMTEGWTPSNNNDALEELSRQMSEACTLLEAYENDRQEQVVSRARFGDQLQLIAMLSFVLYCAIMPWSVGWDIGIAAVALVHSTLQTGVLYYRQKTILLRDDTPVRRHAIKSVPLVAAMICVALIAATVRLTHWAML